MIVRGEFLLGKKDYPVYKFCKENNISCAWDFDKRGQWVEIYFGGNLLMQIDVRTTVDQFKQLMRMLTDDFDRREDFDIPGYDF